MGSESLIDTFGRRLYIEAEVKGSKPGRIRMHGKCADWSELSGRHFRSVKQDGRWKLAGPDQPMSRALEAMRLLLGMNMACVDGHAS